MPACDKPPAMGMPPAEVVIDSSLVADLLADQHPDLARLPLRRVGEGWDNAIFRLGDDLAVRLPRRAAAATLAAHEQRWLPRLANRLTLPVPEPLRVGRPGRGYPWSWSVVPWLPGTTADLNEPDPSQARAFGTFLRSVHVPAPADAPASPLRGVPLQMRAADIEERLERLASQTDLITPAVRRIWREALHAPLDVARTWLHGDLHPRNVLVQDGRITGVIDWGDLTAGDCATDLASLWMLFDDPQARREALAAYGGVSEATLCRARGWAVLFGVILLDAGLRGHPAHAVVGERTLPRVAESR